AGVEHAVLHHACGGAPGVPHEGVEVGDVDDRDVAPVGERVAGAHRVARRGVVLDVDGRDVDAGTASGPLLEEGDLVRPLEDDDVAAPRPQLLGGELAGARRPVPALGATAAVGPAVGQPREEVLGGAGDEGGVPRAVDVPDRDPHTVTSCGTSDRTAATTRSAGMPVRQGCPGTGHSRAREPRHGAAWSPRTTTGTP